MTINKTSLKNGVKTNLGRLKRAARWAYDSIKTNLDKLSAGTYTMLFGLVMAVASGVVFLLGAGIARIACSYCLPEHATTASVFQFVAGTLSIISYIILFLVFLIEALAMATISEEARSPEGGWRYGFATMQVIPIFAVTVFGPSWLMYLYSRDTLSFEAAKMTLRTSVKIMCAEINLTENISISPFLVLCIVVGIALMIYDSRRDATKKEK